MDNPHQILTSIEESPSASSSSLAESKRPVARSISQPAELAGARISVNDDQPTIAVSYATSLELYRRLLKVLTSENSNRVSPRQFKVASVLEEYGRLQIWGDQSRAVLAAGVRGSLDDALRHNLELKKTVVGILEQLSRLLSMAIPLAERRDSDVPQDSDSSMSADSDDSDQYERDGLWRVSKISAVFKHAREQVALLYSLSSLLKRPGVTGKYLRSSTKDASDLDHSHFAQFDYQHVWEKVNQWRRLSRASKGSPMFVDETDSPTKSRERKLRGDDVEFLIQRLGKANTRRRAQLQYWFDHPFVPETTKVQPVLGPFLQRKRPTDNDSQNQDLENRSQAEKSIVSGRSFSTAAISDVLETQTLSRPRTIYAATTLGGRTSNRVPDAPVEIDSNPTFKCPYCQQELESTAMKNRTVWKRHVFRDLRPYVCTFRSCLTPDKQYLTRHDWIYHEQQIHRRQWVCAQDCGQSFVTSDRMVLHLQRDHSTSLLPPQKDVILALCERPVDLSAVETCPLCLAEFSLGRLQIHIAEHMESLALFILPNFSEEDVDSKAEDNNPNSERVVIHDPRQLPQPVTHPVHPLSRVRGGNSLSDSESSTSSSYDELPETTRMPPPPPRRIRKTMDESAGGRPRAPAREPLRQRPTLSYERGSSSYYTGSNARVVIESSRRRRQSYDGAQDQQEGDGRKRNSSAAYPALSPTINTPSNRILTPPPTRRETDYGLTPPLTRRRRTVYNQGTDQVQRDQGKRNPSVLSDTAQTTVTNNHGEIRLRVDGSAPTLQFHGEMEGRTISLHPGEGGMTDIVIGPGPGESIPPRKEESEHDPAPSKHHSVSQPRKPLNRRLGDDNERPTLRKREDSRERVISRATNPDTELRRKSETLLTRRDS